MLLMTVFYRANHILPDSSPPKTEAEQYKGGKVITP